MTSPVPFNPRPEALVSGMEKVLRAALADGYDQGRFGLRYPSGRVEWEIRPPRNVPDAILETWWRGYRRGCEARKEIDHAEAQEVASGPEAHGPVGAPCVRAGGSDGQACASLAGREVRRGVDAAPARGDVVRCGPRWDAIREGVPGWWGVRA